MNWALSVVKLSGSACSWNTIRRTLLVISVLMLSSCAPNASEFTSRKPVSPQSNGEVGSATAQPSAGSREIVNASYSDSDNSRLHQLWLSRTQQRGLTDYPIGTGDVIDVSVPAIKELKKLSVRVSANGTIALPLVGVVHAGGLTEAQFREKLVQRLHEYMYQPQVDVFVKTYRSRQVAVIGAVKQPGLVTLDSPQETILDAIGQAGGITAKAGDEIVLFPAKEGRSNSEGSYTTAGNVSQLPSKRDVKLASESPEGRERFLERETHRNDLADYMSLAKSRHPIIISLRGNSLSVGSRYLDMPARPGDVIVVPGGGDVMVIGWVKNPGHFRVGSGLTVLGAIGAAGGPMYAADTADVHLVRTGRNGQKQVIPVNVQEILAGRAPDIPVKANDVIAVPYSGVKIGPYILYSILSKVGYGFAFGATVP